MAALKWKTLTIKRISKKLRNVCLSSSKGNFKCRFSNDEINVIFLVLVGILYLGNVEFVSENGAIGIDEKTKEDFKIASDFIGLDQNTMLKILTIRKMVDPMNKKQLEKPMNIDQCYACRDAIAKTLYAKMFDWIIKKINSAISSKEEKDKNLKIKKIGILDIFGFEIFEENSFEQMCINYANERLQQFFNNHIFKMEQEEYVREKIDWSQVTFKDNKEIIDLIDNPQNSIFSLLDSQAFIKNTNDKKLRDTIYASLGENKSLILNKKLPDSLIIQHYAGEVQYQISGFIEKNDDQLNNDIGDAMENSKNKLIKLLFRKPAETGKKNDKDAKAGPNKLQSDSLSKQFKKQLDELIKMLGQSNPRYVKCIKPNNVKQCGIFESLDVNRQLLSAGVLESIKIRKQGYSIRRTHEEFVRKYLPLTPGIDIGKKGEKFSDISMEMIKFIANSPEFKTSFNNSTKLIQVGLNKIFMKDEVKIYLECKLNQTYIQYIVKIQSYVRRQKQKIRIKKMREIVKKIKKVVQGFLLRKK
jgi:myosin heavy subunit